MLIGLPTVALMVPLAWVSLTRWSFRMPNLETEKASSEVRQRLNALGPMSNPEKRTLAVFALISIMWISRNVLNDLSIEWGGELVTPLGGLTDHMIAILAVFLCFLVPSGSTDSPEKKLLDWKAAEQIPWGVLLLFGGGMSLAKAISSSGLSSHLGESLAVLAYLPVPVLVLLIAAAVLALTEICSNIATASALMPVLGAIALETQVPLVMMAAPVALAASCAFMLPMATGPNAVAFATDEISISTMAKAGLRVNLIAVAIIGMIAYSLAPLALG